MSKIKAVIDELPECYYCQLYEGIRVPATHRAYSITTGKRHYMCSDCCICRGTNPKKIVIVSLGSGQNE